MQSEIRIGEVLIEDIRFDLDSGQLLTGAFMDYAMRRADSFSAIHCESNPVPTETSPLGVKGAGEAGNVSALPAVGNALINALSPLGIRHIEIQPPRSASGARSTGARGGKGRSGHP